MHREDLTASLKENLPTNTLDRRLLSQKYWMLKVVYVDTYVNHQIYSWPETHQFKLDK